MKEKIEKILTELINSTKSNAIEWKLRDTCFNSTRTHHYHCFSLDNQTSFEVEISLNESLTEIGYNNCLWIKNKNLVDGRKQVPSNSLTKELDTLIYEKYIKPIIVHQFKDEPILDYILDQIVTTQTARDSKISKLLDETDNNILKKLFR